MRNRQAVVHPFQAQSTRTSAGEGKVELFLNKVTRGGIHRVIHEPRGEISSSYRSKWNIKFFAFLRFNACFRKNFFNQEAIVGRHHIARGTSLTESLSDHVYEGCILHVFASPVTRCFEQTHNIELTPGGIFHKPLVFLLDAFKFLPQVLTQGARLIEVDIKIIGDGGSLRDTRTAHLNIFPGWIQRIHHHIRNVFQERAAFAFSSLGRALGRWRRRTKTRSG